MRRKGREKFDRRAADALILRIIEVKAEAMRIGLVKTAHALEPATKAVGWEVAEAMQGKHPLVAL
jgi:hypothetical protein